MGAAEAVEATEEGVADTIVEEETEAEVLTAIEEDMAVVEEEEDGDFLNKEEAKDWTFDPNFLTSAPSEAIEKETSKRAVKYWNLIMGWKNRK